jgi:hypothetical protein
MKTIIEKEVGGDGGKAGLYVEAGELALKVTYPLEKILQPATDVIDKGFDAVENAIPGDWDKAILAPIRAGVKAELLKLVSGE